MRASLECHEGIAMRRMANSWRRKVLSRFGLCDAGTSGKFFAFSAMTESGVEEMVTYPIVQQSS